MSIKGSWRRPRSITREEEELRYKYGTTDMTRAQFDAEFAELQRRGLIQRSGRIIK